MAFISSQCRFLEKDTFGNIINVVESEAECHASYFKTKQTNLFIPCPFELQQLEQLLPFFILKIKFVFLIVIVLILQNSQQHNYNFIYNLLNIFIIMFY